MGDVGAPDALQASGGVPVGREGDPAVVGSEIWNIANLKQGEIIHLIKESKALFRIQKDLSYS